jgi:hypothetical protein
MYPARIYDSLLGLEVDMVLVLVGAVVAYWAYRIGSRMSGRVVAGLSVASVCAAVFVIHVLSGVFLPVWWLVGLPVALIAFATGLSLGFLHRREGLTRTESEAG